jgi:hypothetical protein
MTSKITCLKCNVTLTEQKVRFTYLNIPFWDTLPACPVCRQVYLSEEYAEGKLAAVEKTLEDK